MLALIGFGGNVGDVAGAFGAAERALSARVAVVARSSVWRSAAIGPPQPDFFNAALLVESPLDPLRLLALLQLFESLAGRDRGREQRSGPRPLDLDLLLLRGVVVAAPTLVVPHPRLAERRFALLSASEVAPDWLHPLRQRTLEELCRCLAADSQRCERVGPFPMAGA